MCTGRLGFDIANGTGFFQTTVSGIVIFFLQTIIWWCCRPLSLTCTNGLDVQVGVTGTLRAHWGPKGENTVGNKESE